MEKVHIKRVQFLNVSGFLVYTDRHMILVDTGHPHTTGKLNDVLHKLGRDPSDIGLIVLTHTHFDHAGGAREIREMTGAMLVVHTLEAEYLERGHTPFPPGTRWKGKLLVGLGRIFARKMARYPSVEPDIRLEGETSLERYGIPGRIVHTPGHTRGSVTVVLDDGRAIVGDNVMGIPGKTHYPPFAHDRKGVIRAWEQYLQWGVKTVYPAHGVKVPAGKLEKELPGVRRRYGN